MMNAQLVAASEVKLAPDDGRKGRLRCVGAPARCEDAARSVSGSMR